LRRLVAVRYLAAPTCLERSKTPMADVKKVPCPECNVEFTTKGLVGHRAFKHGVKDGREAKAQTPAAGAPAAPAVDSSKPTDSGARERFDVFKGW
jgi:hypothetical protein